MRTARKMQALVLSLFFVTSLFAQTRPKVAVVLSGGGAKGFAHVALLEALEEEGIPIDLITGTSMGAMIGSLYASGYSAKELRQIVSSTDMMSLILDHAAATNPLPPAAFDSSQSSIISYPVSAKGLGAAPSLLGDQKVLTFMGRLLAKNYDITSFDQLPIPYRSVGTDVLSFTPYVFESESLLKAVRGSMSLPLLFTPAPTGTGRWVLDGGLVNNLPVHLARQLGADIVIACDVASNLPQDTSELSTATDMGIHLFNFFISPNATAQHQDADVLITPDLQPYNTLSFMFPKEIMALGDKAVEQEREAIHAIAVQLQEAGVPLKPAEYDRISLYAEKPAPVVESIIVEDVSAAGTASLPGTASYSWLLNQKLTDAALQRLVTQVTRDRTKYNLASFCFETRPGTAPGLCTLVLSANHYEQNPGIFAIGGTPTLYAAINNGTTTGIVFPEVKLRLHLDEPFSHDYFANFGSTLSAGITLEPQFARLNNITFHVDTGAAIMNGGLSPDTGFSWLNKPILQDTGVTAHLGLETRYLRYSTGKTGIQYTLNNATAGIIQSGQWYGSFVLNSLDSPVTGWSGMRIDAEVSAGMVFGSAKDTDRMWGAEYRQLQMIALPSERKSSIGYELAAGTKRGPENLTASYYDYGGFLGMCGYAPETLVRDYALAGVTWQTTLTAILGMPVLAQFQVKAGIQNPKNTTYSLKNFQKPDAGYGAKLLFDTPVGTVTFGLSHSVTNGKICLSAGMQ